METQHGTDYALLYQRVEDLKAQLAAAQSAKTDAEQRLLDEFIDAGVPKLTVTVPGEAGERTIYMHRQVWARPRPGVSKADIVAALRATPGCEHLAYETFNTNTVSAYLRDLDREDAPLPDTVSAVLEGVPTTSLRVRGS